MIILEVIQGTQQGARFELDAPRFTIGRSPSCQVRLQDYHLSGEHLELSCQEGQYVARDLRSTNGTMIVRGTKRIVLQGPDGWEHPVENGDRFLLGDPSAPVILSCTIEEDSTEPLARVVASKSREELSELQSHLDQAPSDLAAVYRATTALGKAGLDLNAVLATVAEQVLQLLPRATHVTILLADESGERFSAVLARSRHETAGNVPISRAVLRRTLADRTAVLVANAARELEGSESIMAAHIMSSMGVPLWKGDGIRGILQVDNRDRSGIFRERDLELLAILSSQAGLAIENARLYDRLATAEVQARSEAEYFKERTSKPSFADIIGVSAAMKAVFSQLTKVIDTRATIHIEGETGTGKELVARAIHYEGNRKKKLFVAANCASLPENLLESELFGHLKGSFTGADHDKKGLFEVAGGGTLLLDEIAEMSPVLQARLLRVLQEGEIRPVGSSRTKKVDVRIISATNKTLDDEVKAGRFREDLFYRLHVFPVRLPSLRERRDDIPMLARHFMTKYCQEMDKYVAGFSQETMDLLVAYRWPGNVRELEHEVQRLVIQCDPGSFVQPADLAPQIQALTGGVATRPTDGTLKERVEQVERSILREALAANGNNKTKTAKSLGITREGLHKKLAKYGM
ncbi:MAG: sigma 54-interacting transcriptional regulator [Deltaproteobacteria bacterium]|nr:sigma 54-interacting transcriptional regulator [Deltaproteobacteria bacterium]